MDGDTTRRPDETSEQPSRRGVFPGVRRRVRGWSAARGVGRGQTTLDFTVGVTLFLLVLATIFLFVPGQLQPFTQGGQEDIVTVNRVADDLSEQALGDPQTPHVLNETCTVEFFTGVGDPAGCQYSGSSLNERIGVADRRSVNVSIRGNPDTGGDQTDDYLCWDTSDEKLRDCGSGDELLAVGDPAASSGQSSVTARRVVELDGTDVYLVVEMW